MTLTIPVEIKLDEVLTYDNLSPKEYAQLLEEIDTKFHQDWDYTFYAFKYYLEEVLKCKEHGVETFPMYLKESIKKLKSMEIKYEDDEFFNI